MPTVANAIRALEAHPGTAVITGFDLDRCEFSVTTGEECVPFGWGDNGEACLVIAEAFGVHPTLIMGRVRTETVANARHAWVLALRLNGSSYPKIAELTGRKCHGAAMNSVRKAVFFISNDGNFRRRWERAASRLGIPTAPTKKQVDEALKAGPNDLAV